MGRERVSKVEICPEALTKYAQRKKAADEARLFLEVIRAGICPRCGNNLRGNNVVTCPKCGFVYVQRLGVRFTGVAVDGHYIDDAYVYMIDGKWIYDE